MGTKIIEWLSAITTATQEVAPDILVLEFTVVNACLVGTSERGWVLVDTRFENSASFIL